MKREIHPRITSYVSTMNGWIQDNFNSYIEEDAENYPQHYDKEYINMLNDEVMNLNRLNECFVV